MRDRPEPRCVDRWWLFTSPEPHDGREAVKECLGSGPDDRCPAILDCEKARLQFLETDHRSGLHGTWAGKFYPLKRSQRRAA